ncbi:glycosyltransferase involved in cell wall biosynthesis [Prauserella shujinwangii]|uniref:Glycosyltransferase involved in cell wall biosynthesis n=1 Tax=Prauserella shujinwangii TaxID=1453103 RepID=A0A2T0LMM1_9PSEU|nr:glycosyltransferase family 1 protein [Prauserella shujinwangii]PRX44290.1 glycosyltransferase involved in cell wall biosynthesis [Prauserella shujinwangii]
MPELVVLAEQLLSPVPGGTGRYTAELLRALAATAPEGWTVGSAVARHADVTAARVPGVRGPRRLPLPPKALVAAWQAGVPLWPGGAAVHAPTPLAPPRAPRGRSLSVTVHDTVPWTHPETLTPRGVRWHRAMIGRAARGADALVVPTEAVRGELAGFAAGPAPVHVVGHGVTTLPVAEPPAGLPPRYVLAVGTLEPRKGIDVLVAAMALLAEPEVPLLLAGQPGWGGLDPLALAREHGLGEHRVRVLGRLSDAELAAVLRGASVLAAPSLAEGFGLPVLEAMAAGVPVVHSDAPALAEVAGGAGRMVPRGDARALATALHEVLSSGPLAAGLAAAGRERAAAFSWRRAALAVWRLHVPGA